MDSRATANVGAPARDRGRHFTHLDGVRGVSILLVMLFHERVHLTDHALSPADVIGAYGVDLFFVLSGCCLALPYLARIRSGESNVFDVGTYVTRRVLRILPAFAVAIVLFATATWLPLVHDRLPSLGAVLPVSPRDALAQLLFLDRDVPLLNPSFWSLALEWRWYALFPLALVLWTRVPRVVAGLALAAVAWSLVSGGASRDLGMIDAFLAGLLAAEILLRGNVTPVRAAIWLLASLAIALPLGRGTYFPVQMNPAWHLVALCFVVWAGAEPRARVLLEMRWLVAIGRTAYSTYLVHEPIVRAIELYAVPRFGDGVAMVFATAGALGAGFTLAHLVELPLQRRETIARVLAAALPSVVRALDFCGVPQTFAIANEAALARRREDAKVVDLRARAALKAVS